MSIVVPVRWCWLGWLAVRAMIVFVHVSWCLQEVVFNPSYDRVCVSLLVQDEDDLQSEL